MIYKWKTEVAGQPVELSVSEEQIIQDRTAQAQQIKLLLEFAKEEEEEKAKAKSQGRG